MCIFFLVNLNCQHDQNQNANNESQEEILHTKKNGNYVVYWIANKKVIEKNKNKNEIKQK